jgi:acetylglutamate kinase
MNRDILYKLFEISGNEKDALIFLKNFRSIEPQKFALIHIDSVTFAEYGESIIYDLKVLQRLNLFPIVVVPDSIIDYIRVFYKESIDWNDLMDDNKLKSGIISFDDLDERHVTKIISEKKIPFVVYGKENIFDVMHNCLKKLESLKLIFLVSEIPFWDKQSNSPISIINLQNDYHRLIQEDCLTKFSLDFLNQIRDVLEKYRFLKSVSITTPITLFKELFTIKGSGTYIKLGSNIKMIKNRKEISLQKLVLLLESSFKKKIKESFIEEEFHSIIMESEYRGAAIIKMTDNGALLSKFAVDEIARGEGIGREIWDKMKEVYKTIIWRANPKNPINKWYAQESDGIVKLGRWNVYWIGLPVSKIPLVCDYLSELPADFYER